VARFAQLKREVGDGGRRLAANVEGMRELAILPL
jgi:hypothetical protein